MDQLKITKHLRHRKKRLQKLSTVAIQKNNLGVVNIAIIRCDKLYFYLMDYDEILLIDNPLTTLQSLQSSKLLFLCNPIADQRLFWSELMEEAE